MVSIGKVEKQNEQFRHTLLFYCRKGNNATMHKKLYAVHSNEGSKEQQCQNWFAKFRSGDLSLTDEQRFEVQLKSSN